VGFTLLAVCGCQHRSSGTFQGYVEGEFVYVSCAYSGPLQKLYVKRGDQVKAGQELFVLDDTVQKVALQKTKAQLALAENEFARQDNLMRAHSATSQKDLDRARSERDQVREEVTRAEWDLSQMHQLAPADSIVFDTLYREGEWVANGKPVLVLLPPGNIKARAFLPQSEASKLQINDKVRVHVDSIAEELSAKVSFISPHLEYTPPVIYSRESREKLLVMIEALFEPELAAKLHPGQPLDLRLGS